MATKIKQITEDDINKQAVNPNTGLKVTETPSPSDSMVKLRDVWNNYGSQYGLTNDMLGYDSNSKMIKAGGTDFMKQVASKDGYSYDDENTIMSAIDNYAKSKGLVNTSSASGTGLNANANNSYESPYTAKIDSILNSLMGTQNFSYNPESDPVYQALKGQYSAAGDKALTNTMSEASALTGGRLNSWATTAGQQAKSGFDQQLMSQIPALADTAYNRFQGDINNKSAILDAIMNIDNTGYNRYADTRNFDRDVLTTDRNYNRGVIESDRNFGLQEDQFDFQKETDARNYDRSVFESDRGYKYQVTRDNILDGQWLKQFSAEEQQRAVSNALQSRQISVSEANAALNRQQFNYSKEQDSKEWKYKLEQAAKESKANVDVLGSQYSDMMNSPDPSKWLTENAPYMTKDELKALKSLMPSDKNDVINKLMSQMDKK